MNEETKWQMFWRLNKEKILLGATLLLLVLLLQGCASNTNASQTRYIKPDSADLQACKKPPLDLRTHEAAVSTVVDQREALEECSGKMDRIINFYEVTDEQR